MLGQQRQQQFLVIGTAAAPRKISLSFFLFFLLLSQELLLPHRQLTASDERSLSSPPAHVKALCCKLPFSVDTRTLSLW